MVLRCRVEHRQGLAIQDGRNDAGRARAGKRPASGSHLVKHATVSEQITPGVDCGALELLRRHVLDRADHRPLRGEGLCGRSADCTCVVFPRGRRLFREPEVEDLGAGLDQHDVSRFQIAVGNAPGMRSGKRVRDLNCVLEYFRKRHRPPGESGRQRLALEVFHDEEADGLV